MPYWKLEDHEIIYDFQDQERLNMQLKMGFLNVANFQEN